MENRSATWFVNLLCCFSYPVLAFCENDWLWEGDTSLVLSQDEPEHLVSMTGELSLLILNKNSEHPELGTYECWVVKMNPESFEIAYSTPVHGAFHSPASIRESSRCQELELTGEFDKNWLRKRVGETVTLSGYLWHSHTDHHHTPVMMDTAPWFK